MNSNKNNHKNKASIFGDDEDSEEEVGKVEQLTGFNSGEAKGITNKSANQPLVIESQPNVDWRSKKSSLSRYKPNKDQNNESYDLKIEKLNDEPQKSGLISRHIKSKSYDDDNGDESKVKVENEVKVDESLDEKAIKSLINDEKLEFNEDHSEIPSIINETDAFRADVSNRVDESTLEDYEKVPVHQFGAALLRGMGWKDGMPASRTRNGPTTPYVPESRPALLGIGAKAKPTSQTNDRKQSKDFKVRKPDMTYRPISKRETTATSSPRTRRSPSPQIKERNNYNDERRSYDRREIDHRRRDDYDIYRTSDRSRRREDFKRDRRYDDSDRERRDYDTRDYDKERKKSDFEKYDRDRRKKYERDNYDKDRYRYRHRRDYEI